VVSFVFVRTVNTATREWRHDQKKLSSAEKEERRGDTMPEKKQKRRGHGEGSIYQRKDGRWGATITLVNGKRKTLYGKTRNEVADKLNTALQEQKQGLLVTGPGQTVAHYLHYWLEKVHNTTIRASTYALYRRHLKNHIIPALGHIQLQKLTADQVQAFCSKMSSEGLSSGTIRLIHTILYTALGDAVRWKRLATNVCDAVKLPRLSQREVNPLDQEQAQRLLQAAQGNRLVYLLTVALTTGMRLGEILSLHWDDVDLEKRVLQVRSTVDYVPGRGRVESEPKTEAGKRQIVLPQMTVEALKLQRAHQLEARLKAGKTRQERGLVFANRNGGYFSRAMLYANFKKLLKEAGQPEMHFHDLRHSAATILLSMGVPANVVQEILGHANFGTTMNIYGHVLPSMQRDAIAELDGFFKGK
jgi:integrase